MSGEIAVSVSDNARGAPLVPVQVVDFDLASSDIDLEPRADVRALRVLLRVRGVPIGWLHLNPPRPVKRKDVLHAAAQQLGSSALAAALRDELSPADYELPPISIVVCTRERQQSLRNCIDSLLALDYPACEIIIVDNAPISDATERLVASFARADRIHYVREETAGLDWARNRGLAEARHGIIAYTDDDVRVDPGWLRGIARGFAEPGTKAVTGLVLPAELETAAQVVFEDWYGGMGKGFFPFSYHCAGLNSVKRLGAHHLGVGANMAFRRDWLRERGGFDTALDVGTPSHGAGDLDIFERTIMSGALARYEPTALVWHQHRRDLSGLRRQLTDNGRAFGVYLISRWRKQQRPVGEVVSYAFRIWFGWMVGRALRRVLRRERMPLSLQAREWWGALQAPWAYIATYRSDNRIRQLRAGAGSD